MVVTFVAVLATIGVYGIVAAIVRMDDFGMVLLTKKSKTAQFIGQKLIILLPLVIRGLGIIGTIALISVAGGIFVHKIEYVHHLVQNLPALVGEFLAGIVGAILSFAVIKLLQFIWSKIKKK